MAPDNRIDKATPRLHCTLLGVGAILAALPMLTFERRIRMAEMLLLGAGASVDAGLPTSFEMTKRIVDLFWSEQSYNPVYAKVVSFVVGGLLLNKGVKGTKPFSEDVNVEELFSAIELLSQRNQLEIAPFIGSWHSVVEELDRKALDYEIERLQTTFYQNMMEALKSSVSSSRVGSSGTIDSRIHELVRNPRYSGGNRVSSAVDDMVSNKLKSWVDDAKRCYRPSYQSSSSFKNALLPTTGGGSVFQSVASRMVAMLPQLVCLKDSAKVGYFSPIRNVLEMQRGITIATLNYDNCVELFCGSNGIECETGIDSWPKLRSFDIEERSGKVQLLKLHGSVDWVLSQSGDVDSFPHNKIRVLSSESVMKGEHRPAVIFGQRNKLTANGPFLDILNSFQRELLKADNVTVVGYSFGDEHINVCLSQWLNEKPDRKIRIVDPFFASSTSPFAMLLKQRESRIDVHEIGAAEAFERFWR